jgi:predicted component of type VI protein secretion system
MTLSVQILDIPESETLARRDYHLAGERIAIGRDFTADLCLPDISGHLSRTHLLLSRAATGGWQVRDVSTNGSALNGSALPTDTPMPLADGDILGFCGYRVLIGFWGEADVAVAPPVAAAPPRFEPETDPDSDGPLLADTETEEALLVSDDFAESRLDNLDALMFDPFADGPGLRDNPDDQVPGTTSGETGEIEPPRAVSATEIAQSGGSSDLVDLVLRLREEVDHSGRRYKEDAAEAMARAIDRFLVEIDPETLEPEYSSYISGWSSRKKRFWQIHKKQFARKRESGEFRRSFLALFAEEMRRR